ncbi:glycosyltransferase [Ruthenibacterium sp. CLA-JM-H11]|uniref:Glycosyltransferase n=1 Tax=Ruthenibacterium intestinale TaxID=3133163 RepID=A0ABV1GFY1_9FIRM
MMRIAIFAETYFPFISGIVTHIQTLKESLEESGHEVLIVTASPKTNRHYVKDGVLYCPAIPMKRIYGYGFSNPLNLERLKIIREFNPDVLHIHTEFSMGIFAQFAARKLKKPIVYTLHTMYDDYLFYVAPHKFGQKMVKPAAHLYFRSTANKATEIIGPSLKVVEFLRRCGVERHINIIPNTVDLSDFLPQNVSPDDISSVRKTLGIREGDTAICFVGRLGKEKSIDTLIEFFAQNCKGNEQYKLFIIGDGPEKNNLARQIQDLNVTSQVKLLGRIEHASLPPYYHACDLFATASLSEMNSISMLEAMASGLYVLQRLDIYNKNQIEAGENGETFTSSKEFGALVFAQAAMTAEQKAERRERVTAFTNRYGKKEFVAQVLNVYERAIAEYKK